MRLGDWPFVRTVAVGTSRQAGSSAMKGKILVVDDMPEILLMITELLSGAGYSVLAASTFEDGRRLAAGAHPDLVLIDVRLGAYNGIQIALKEHIEHPLRPVIVMTAYIDPVIEAEARTHGAELLEKPIQADRLLSLIERLLAERESPGESTSIRDGPSFRTLRPPASKNLGKPKAKKKTPKKR